MKKEYSWIITGTLVLLILSATPVKAEDWFDSFIDAPASGFEGADRNYYFGYSASLRIPRSRDYLFSVALPNLQMGCGGLDLNLGGLSYLKWDKIVEKGKAIMQNATTIGAAYLFQMGLNRICQECANIWNKMEKFSNMLNSIYIDDCEAAKGLVMAVANPSQTMEKIETRWAEFKNSLGINVTDNRAEVKDEFKFNPFSNTVNFLKDAYGLIDGSTITELLESDRGGYFLGTILRKRGVSDDQVQLIIGLVGDIYFKKEGNNRLITIWLNPCSENDINTLINDKPYYRPDPESGCEPIVGGKSIREKVETAIDNIMNAIDNKQTPRKEDLQIALMTGYPILKMLHDARVVSRDFMRKQIGGLIKEVAPYLYLEGVLNSVQYQVISAIENGKYELSKQNASGEVQDYVIHLDNIKVLSKEKIKELKEYLKEQKMQIDYTRKIIDYVQKANRDAMKTIAQTLPDIYR